MELIDGATLAEHITSLKEKKEQFSESQVWKIFIQVLITALTETLINKHYGVLKSKHLVGFQWNGINLNTETYLAVMSTLDEINDWLGCRLQ